LNVETDKRSGLCLVHGRRRELDKLESSFTLLSGQVGHSAEQSPMPVWIRRSPELLEVLTGFLLSVDLENVGELGLPLVALAPVAQRLNALEGYLRQYQTEAVWAAATAPFGRGIIVAPTGSGKTRVAHGLAQVVDGLWVYLAPNQSLAQQTAEHAPKNLVCTSYGSVKEDVLLSCDGLIADELHRAAAHSYSRVMLRSRASFRIGMSATPLMRRDPRNVLTMGLFGPVLYSISLQRLQAEGVLPQGSVKTIVL